MKKEYWINVKHVDNRLVIFLKGETIWDSGIIHDDPELDQYINITDHLDREHATELIFEGFNDDYAGKESLGELNPWHFHYRLFVRETDGAGNTKETELIKPYNEKHMSNPNIRAINNSYLLMYKEDGFTVVSNSLSQQFYN